MSGRAALAPEMALTKALMSYVDHYQRRHCLDQRVLHRNITFIAVTSTY
jgi:hypothetical protein